MILALMLDTDDSVDFPGNDGAALGRPLATYPLMAAKASGRVERAYAVTSSPPVKSAAVQYGGVLIDPPAGEAPIGAEKLLRHGWQAVREEHKDLSAVEFVLVLFANAPCVTGALINEAIDALQNQPQIDSAASVSPLNRWNPFHARRQDAQGLLEPYVVAAPQPRGEVLYPDWSLQVLRPRCLEGAGTGRPPFPWLGAKVLPVKQWGGGPIDYQWQIPSLEYWLKKHGVSDSSAGLEPQPKPQTDRR